MAITMKEEFRDKAGKLHIKSTCPHCLKYVDIQFEDYPSEEWKLTVSDRLDKAYLRHVSRYHPGDWKN